MGAPGDEAALSDCGSKPNRISFSKTRVFAVKEQHIGDLIMKLNREVLAG